MNIERRSKYINSPFRWLIEGVIWGLFMFLFMEVFLKWAQHEDFQQKKMLIGLAWWLGSGLIFGLVSKYFRAFLAKREAKKKSA
jgi:hypothetical protein